MKKYLYFIALLCLFFVPLTQAFAVHVNGYYRSNGTYVNSYERSAPDGNPYNNYGYPGNYNPNTGSITGGSQSSYLNNYYKSSGSSYSPSTYNYSYPTIPSYNYSAPIVPTIPSCPSMSSYSSISGNCQCYSGYVVDKDIFGEESCVSGNSYCHKKIGIMSSYDSSTKKCECDLGYEFDGSNCVYKSSNYNYSYGNYSGSGTCPLNSSQSLTDSTKCTCNTGFQTNLAKDACIPQTIPQATKIKINRMLKEGSMGEDVAQLQQFLTDKGYYSGPISNSYNYGTKMAVTKFQKANSLSQTGIVNVKTRALINSF